MAGSADEVRNLLVQSRIERVRTKRVDILDKALGKRDQLQSEVFAIKPPGKKAFTVDAEGKSVEIPAVYTQDELKKLEEDRKQYNKKLKEATEKLQKFDDLLEQAMTQPSDKVFEKLAKMVDGKGSEEAASE